MIRGNSGARVFCRAGTLDAARPTGALQPRRRPGTSPSAAPLTMQNSMADRPYTDAATPGAR
jgi:hypothetical protein